MQTTFQVLTANRKMLVQNSLHLILNFVGIMFLINQGKSENYNVHSHTNMHFWYTALATSCQTSAPPSEYAYRGDSVNRAESTSANCRRYPVGFANQQHYIHCDGTQLLLADSNLGQEQYQNSEYYWWPAGSDGQLLFIFPTAVSLATITLHYYSDNVRGLPSLRFYAVPDDFDIWDVPTTSYPYVDVASVPPSGEPAGRRNISIDISFNTKKVLMYKFSSNFQFAVSEVEFFNCIQLGMISSIMTNAMHCPYP